MKLFLFNFSEVVIFASENTEKNFCDNFYENIFKGLPIIKYLRKFNLFSNTYDVREQKKQKIHSEQRMKPSFDPLTKFKFF